MKFIGVHTLEAGIKISLHPLQLLGLPKLCFRVELKMGQRIIFHNGTEYYYDFGTLGIRSGWNSTVGKLEIASLISVNEIQSSIITFQLFPNPTSGLLKAKYNLSL